MAHPYPPLFEPQGQLTPAARQVIMVWRIVEPTAAHMVACRHELHALGLPDVMINRLTNIAWWPDSYASAWHSAPDTARLIEVRNQRIDLFLASNGYC
jgi:hypothetical protein